MTSQPPSPPPAPPGYGGPAPPRAAGPRTSGLAIGSLVVGLAGLCTGGGMFIIGLMLTGADFFPGLLVILAAPCVCGVASAVAVLLGIVALRRVHRSGGALGGTGLAVAGIVVSGLSLLLALLSAAALVHFWLALDDTSTFMDYEIRRSIERAANALEMYNLDVGHYPTEAEGGLEALRAGPPGAGDAWAGPYLEEPPTDGWGNPLHYEPPDPDHLNDFRGHTYRIWSVGPDGIDGTPDDVER